MKNYQIVVKGIATNKIDILETTCYASYKEILKTIKESELIHVITTNIYIK